MKRVVEGLKSIAEYVAKKTGRTFTVDAARAAYRRHHDPLPTEWFNGRIGASDAELDAWIKRQHGKRVRNRTARAA